MREGREERRPMLGLQSVSTKRKRWCKHLEMNACYKDKMREVLIQNLQRPAALNRAWSPLTGRKRVTLYLLYVKVDTIDRPIETTLLLYATADQQTISTRSTASIHPDQRSSP